MTTNFSPHQSTTLVNLTIVAPTQLTVLQPRALWPNRPLTANLPPKIRKVAPLSYNSDSLTPVYAMVATGRV